MESGAGDSSYVLQTRLEQLNERWEFVRCETERRQLELENNLSQVTTNTSKKKQITEFIKQLVLVGLSPIASHICSPFSQKMT